MGPSGPAYPYGYRPQGDLVRAARTLAPLAPMTAGLVALHGALFYLCRKLGTI